VKTQGIPFPPAEGGSFVQCGIVKQFNPRLMVGIFIHIGMSMAARNSGLTADPIPVNGSFFFQLQSLPGGY